MWFAVFLLIIHAVLGGNPMGDKAGPPIGGYTYGFNEGPNIGEIPMGGKAETPNGGYPLGFKEGPNIGGNPMGDKAGPPIGGNPMGDKAGPPNEGKVFVTSRGGNSMGDRAGPPNGGYPYGFKEGPNIGGNPMGDKAGPPNERKVFVTSRSGNSMGDKAGPPNGGNPMGDKAGPNIGAMKSKLDPVLGGNTGSPFLNNAGNSADCVVDFFSQLSKIVGGKLNNMFEVLRDESFPGSLFHLLKDIFQNFNNHEFQPVYKTLGNVVGAMVSKN